MLMSHSRNGDEFQTPRHHSSPANVKVLAFVILVNQNLSGIHEPWHAIMEWHQHVGVKNIVPFGAGYGISFSQNKASLTSLMVSIGNVPPWGTKRYMLPLLTLVFFSRVNIEQQECCAIFGIFWGSLGHFYTLTEFSMHSCA